MGTLLNDFVWPYKPGTEQWGDEKRLVDVKHAQMQIG
jgi:hypothetical protein